MKCLSGCRVLAVNFSHIFPDYAAAIANYLCLSFSLYMTRSSSAPSWKGLADSSSTLLIPPPPPCRPLYSLRFLYEAYGFRIFRCSEIQSNYCRTRLTTETRELFKRVRIFNQLAPKKELNGTLRLSSIRYDLFVVC